MLHKQTLEIQQVKQIATLKENYSSSQTAEFHQSLRVFQRSLNSSTVATVSITRPSGR